MVLNQKTQLFLKKYIDAFKRSPKTQELIAALQANENADVQNLHFAELIIFDSVRSQKKQWCGKFPHQVYNFRKWFRNFK